MMKKVIFVLVVILVSLATIMSPIFAFFAGKMAQMNETSALMNLGLYTGLDVQGIIFTVITGVAAVIGWIWIGIYIGKVKNREQKL